MIRLILWAIAFLMAIVPPLTLTLGVVEKSFAIMLPSQIMLIIASLWFMGVLADRVAENSKGESVGAEGVIQMVGCFPILLLTVGVTCLQYMVRSTDYKSLEIDMDNTSLILVLWIIGIDSLIIITIDVNVYRSMHARSSKQYQIVPNSVGRSQSAVPIRSNATKFLGYVLMALGVAGICYFWEFQHHMFHSLATFLKLVMVGIFAVVGGVGIGMAFGRHG